MGTPILHFKRVGSTMEKARELLGGSHADRFIVIAEEQTEGRGRVEGRRWEGASGASLLMTLCLRGEFSSAEGLPLRIGLAVHTALSELAPLSLRIKWPNDIMGFCARSDGHFLKLGGLLCETTGGWLLAGIGLNLRPEAYPPEMRMKATSLIEVAGAARSQGQGQKQGSADLPEVRVLASAIDDALAAWLGRKDWRQEYEKVMWAIGEEVSFVVGHPDHGAARRGTIRGIDGDGRLMLSREGGGLEAFWSGEISSLAVSGQRP